MTPGDCSTCGYSVGNGCQGGMEGSGWQESEQPTPCPCWIPQGPKWKIMQYAWYKRNPWPFPTS